MPLANVGPQPPLRGQDRRLAEELQQLLIRIMNHDNRIADLGANSTRSRQKFIDPSDQAQTGALQVLLDRSYWLQGQQSPG